ncbi:hypothetical protein DDB_G0278385 [Dictyostelium discoideum AX4]|uniref:Uncharacterized protein n=1 Tax=Dictyostelium discoideum TaxID=44689 RepID=Q54Y68_DICDI|nr:hypothetical protein DDB_G0278385 [Dictyostelium discoideum AX4]EAL68365.1 hypothetical protein DDB_G0278385 [Dictyostelium discoideum AX4]|eukprot:XP_642334.1 hypothetical protein DDB_G0278385 [Dictyostelium discoideum AX4]
MESKSEINFILNKTKVPPVIFGGIFSTFGVDKNMDYYYNYSDYQNKNNNNNDRNYTKNNKIINSCQTVQCNNLSYLLH